MKKWDVYLHIKSMAINGKHEEIYVGNYYQWLKTFVSSSASSSSIVHCTPLPFMYTWVYMLTLKFMVWEKV